MAEKSTSSSSKGAPLMKAGHTTTNQYGSGPSLKNPTRKTPTELSLK